jgi:hypothetical protein
MYSGRDLAKMVDTCVRRASARELEKPNARLKACTKEEFESGLCLEYTQKYRERIQKESWPFFYIFDPSGTISPSQLDDEHKTLVLPPKVTLEDIKSVVRSFKPTVKRQDVLNQMDFNAEQGELADDNAKALLKIWDLDVAKPGRNATVPMDDATQKDTGCAGKWDPSIDIPAPK